MATSTTLIINAIDYSTNFVKATITRRPNGASTIVLTLNDHDKSLFASTPFATPQEWELKVSSYTLLKGRVDDVRYITPPYGPWTVEVYAKDYMWDVLVKGLGQQDIPKEYSWTYADKIIETALVDAACEVTFTSSDILPQTKATARRENLFSFILKLLEAAHAEIYVDSNKALKLQLISSPISSGITITSAELLDCSKEYRGSGILNYVDQEGGEVKDQWTEKTASDFGVGTNCTTAVDDTGLIGKYCIKTTRTTTGAAALSFDFPYPPASAGQIDFSIFGERKMRIWVAASTNNGKKFRLRFYLKDYGGNILEWWSTKLQSSGATTWSLYELPIGLEVDIFSVGGDHWIYSVGSTFSWGAVVRFQVQVDPNDPPGEGDYCNVLKIDGWHLQGIKTFKSKQDSPSIASYRSRYKRITRRGRESVKNFEAELTSYVESSKDPIDLIHLTVKGSVGLKTTTEGEQITNGDFETGSLSPWVGTGVISTDQNHTDGGAYSAKLLQNQYIEQAVDDVDSNDVRAPGGFSIWFWVTQAGGYCFEVKFYYTDATTSTTTVCTPAGGSEWKQATQAGLVIDANKYINKIRITAQAWGGGITGYVDDVSMVGTGGIPSAGWKWNPGQTVVLNLSSPYDVLNGTWRMLEISETVHPYEDLMRGTDFIVSLELIAETKNVESEKLEGILNPKGQAAYVTHKRAEEERRAKTENPRYEW